MSARVDGRADGNRFDVEVDGPVAEHVGLLAAYAERVADLEGSRPDQVLRRAQSRAAREPYAGVRE